MAGSAERVCILADMNDAPRTGRQSGPLRPTGTPSPNPDDLLVLLAVSRSGRFTTAAETLGLNHTTVSRRIAALEAALGGRLLARSPGGWQLTDRGQDAVRAAEEVENAVRALSDDPSGSTRLSGVVRLSATDGFSAYIAAPAIAALQQRHPLLRAEIVTATRRALQHRSGLDIEIVVGEPQVHRAEAHLLGEYALGMYASHTYLVDHGTPASTDELVGHPLIYFIDSILQVDDLDAPRRLVPSMHDGISSTNVFVHVEATRAGAGIGFLPCFMADRHADLVRVMPADYDEHLPYWMVVRSESLRQSAVAAVADALRERTRAMAGELAGHGGDAGAYRADQPPSIV
ncbi:LysR family transcriptional regulator [Subtercola boreus]|uniref:LysR family transcriptional regulator n=2 Tax=Subtercola boreus TaxID=120213 RepID=A0A3E0W0L5_9MICO|nr:LysR family transcriptional regulator [Subtercola boreus]